MKSYDELKDTLTREDLIRKIVFYGIHWLSDKESIKTLGDLIAETNQVMDMIEIKPEGGDQ